jgi:hypothetical protein
MMRPFSLRRLIPFTLVVLLLAACSDSGDEAADAILAPTTTAAATTTTPAPTTTAAATHSVIPPDVEQTIDDYHASWEASDGDAFLATVTSDLLINEYWYIGTGNASDGTKLYDIISDGPGATQPSPGTSANETSSARKPATSGH